MSPIYSKGTNRGTFQKELKEYIKNSKYYWRVGGIIDKDNYPYFDDIEIYKNKEVFNEKMF